MHTTAKKKGVFLLLFFVMAHADAQQVPSSDLPISTGKKDTAIDNLKHDTAARKQKNAPTIGNYEHMMGTPAYFFDLSYFNGHATGKQAVLEWATFCEPYKVHFDVERSSNASDFVRIAVIIGRNRDSTT